MLQILKLQSFCFVFVGDHGKLFLSSMYMLLLQLSYISQRAEIQFRSRGMSCGLARFNDGPGSAVMKEEDL